MIVIDAFTKFVHIYPLRNKSQATILENLKLFLQVTSLKTKYIITDNYTVFRSGQWLKDLAVLNIQVPRSTPYASSARGEVECCVRLVKYIIEKLLLNCKTMEFSSTLIWAASLLNNTWHPAIRTCPCEIYFGKNHLDAGPMGSQAREEKYTSRLMDAPLVAQMNDLRDDLAIQAAEVRKHLEATKIKNHEKINKKRVVDPGFEPGDIVFVINHTLAPVGVNTKFRPKLFKSPYVVIKVAYNVMVVRRCADNYVTQIRTDDAKKYRPRTELFQQIPAEMRDIIGRPLDAKVLEDIAKVDTLDPIYKDHLGSEPTSSPLTRNRARAMKDAGEQDEPAELEEYGEEALENPEEDKDLADAEADDFSKHVSWADI
jgi:hypothetical protein